MIEGNTRIIEVYDNYVAKIAKNIFGIKSNRKEYELWISTHNPYLAEVMNHSDDFLYLDMDRDEIPSFFKRIKIAKELSMLKRLGINDVMWYNVGERKDGTPVIFDYGGAIVSWSGFMHRFKRLLGVAE